VYDPNYVSTYRKSGALSGRKFNKIHLLPVSFAQQVVPEGDASEKGITSVYNTMGAVVIDPSCGVIPHIGDILRFDLEGDYSTWEVVERSNSGTFESPYWKCIIKQTRLFSNFEDQVIAEYMYVEYAKHIFTVSNAVNYIKLITRLDEIVMYLNTSAYQHNLDYHLFGPLDKDCFPEIETMLATHSSTMATAGNLLVGVKSETVHDDSIINVLCMPTLFDSTHVPIYTFIPTDTTINPRCWIWRQYNEFVTDSEGTVDLFDMLYGDDAIVLKNAVTAFISYLNGSDYEQTETAVLIDLMNESVDFLEGVWDYVTDTMMASNSFEAVVEYCIVSKKLLTLTNAGVDLS